MSTLQRFLILCLFAIWAGSCYGDELKTSSVRIRFDRATGRILDFSRLADNSVPVTGVITVYHLLAESGDLIADEAGDRAASVSGKPGELIYQCANPDLPRLIIRKRYWIENDGLRRELTFINQSTEKRYIMPFTESHFEKQFKKDGYYFGAGYLGPYRPAAEVRRPLRVETYKQSSKGMVLSNSDTGVGSYAHYRVKINDTIVYPWWQSTIGTYRETADRLYYLPNGWRMCLGTLDMEPNGGSIRLTDAFNYFPGDIFTFFNDIYGRDREIQDALAAIPQSPCSWTDDVFAVCAYSDESNLRYLNRMVKNGTFIVASGLFFQWADYRLGKTHRSYHGGEYTYNELQTFCRSFRQAVPRARHFNYNITVSATFDSPILQEHPEWFRKYGRNGKEDSLFPGVIPNYQTMMNNPECRDFMANHLFDTAKEFGLDMIYLDEAQQQNTINWQSGELIRDDHNIELWELMKKRSVEEKIPLFFNGSGQPFADINYIEALEQLKSDQWRDFAGVALGLELFSQYRPQGRISLIGWYGSKKITDYANRCVALGWIPVSLYPSPLLTMRAVYEVGKTLPIPARYTPDWKKNFNVDVESYSVKRRDCNDVILSFINRKQKNEDIPVTVDLVSLGFSSESRINVWAMPTKHCSKDDPDYVLSEDEYAANYRKYGWGDGFLSAPELIYSGKATGTLKHTFYNMQQDDMVQLVITRSPAALYCVDGVPVNYFFTGHKNVKIENNEFFSGKNNTELIFADKESVFTKIMANGKELPVRQEDVGGLLCQVVTLPAGKYALKWETEERSDIHKGNKLQTRFRNNPPAIEISGDSPDAVYAVELRGRTRITGKSPLPLPEQYENGTYLVRKAGSKSGGIQIELNGGKDTEVHYQPNPKRSELFSVEKTNITRQGIHITAKAVGATYGTAIRRLQENLLPSEVIAEPEKLLLHSVTTRKESGEDSNHYAGFEINGMQKLHLKITSHFYGQYDNIALNHHVYGQGIPALDFAGFIVDYKVRGNYAHRVAFSVGLFNSKLENRFPKWGCNRKQDRHIDLGDLINRAKESVFILDLAKYAPPEWDGTAFFSVGCNHILPSRGLTVELLGAGNGESAVIVGRDAGDLRVMPRKIPEALSLGCLPEPLNFKTVLSGNTWKKWARIPYLLPLPATGEILEAPTEGFCAYDKQNLYFVIHAQDQNRQPLITEDQPWENDRIEFYFDPPHGKGIIQIAADAKGRLAKFIDREQSEADGLFCATKINDQNGYSLFFAIPWTQLGIREVYPGISFHFNLCRVRLGAKKELSSWSPVERLFNETPQFGTLRIGNLDRTTGKYSEITIK